MDEPQRKDGDELGEREPENEPSPPIEVSIPIRLRLTAAALTKQLDEVLEALKDRLGLALANSHKTIEQNHPGAETVGWNIEFKWVGSSDAGVSAAEQHEIEERIREIIDELAGIDYSTDMDSGPKSFDKGFDEQ